MREEVRLDTLDRALLDLLQEAFPLSASPWEDAGKKLGISEGEVLFRLRRLKEAGVIRRIGGILSTQDLRYRSCLCAMHVPEERIKEAAETINRSPGVTHNYEREGTYNLWFTLTTSSKQAEDRQIAEWEKTLKLPVFRFPSGKVYKRRVLFKMTRKEELR